MSGAAVENSPVLIESRTPQTTSDEDGNKTVTVGITNDTNRVVTLTAALAHTDPDCKEVTGTKELAREFFGEMKIEYGTDCVGDEPIKLTEGKFGDLPGRAIAPLAPVEKKKPEWDTLTRGFGIGGAGSLLLVLIIYGFWVRRCWKHGAKIGILRPLPHIRATWSFKENWATDVTAFGALFTGLFGTSETVKAVIGGDAETMLATATIAAAIAAALVIASPIVLLALKRYSTSADGTRTGDFTVAGVLLSAVLILTSACGQLYVIAETGRSFDLGGLEKAIWPALVFAVLFLALYAIQSLWTLLVQGTNTPPPSPLDPAIASARIIARPLWHQANLNAETEFMKGSVKDEALATAVQAAKLADAAEKTATTAAERAKDAEASRVIGPRRARKRAAEAREAERDAQAARAKATEAAEAVGSAGESQSDAELYRDFTETVPLIIQGVTYPVDDTGPGDDYGPKMSGLI